ncbi:MAG: hypothetical protein Ta2G_04540 [Termitinemataceae bacterium]|nr:MAG: hypothetical protein Ta2G_04540 [Termitinemataceae bacterium]
MIKEFIEELRRALKDANVLTPEVKEYLDSLLSNPDSEATPEWNNYFKGEGGLFADIDTNNIESNDWAEDFPELISFIETKDSGAWKILVNKKSVYHKIYDPEIYNKAKYGQVKNGQIYEAYDAAEEVVRGIFSQYPTAIQSLEELAKKHPAAIIARVHSKESKNRLPAAFASAIGDKTGLVVDDDIVQINKVEHTGSKDKHRLANRNIYYGHVEQGKEYILVDDVFSRGGSQSELRRYIELNGGKVIQFVALADGGKGKTVALKKETLSEMLDRYGEKELNKFTKEIDLYGGNYRAYTEPEAQYILSEAPDVKSLDTLRDSIIAERKQGSKRILQEGVQGQTPLDTTLYELEQDETGYDDSQKKEASDAIQTVIAQYGYTPEFSGFRKQVGAALTSTRIDADTSLSTQSAEKSSGDNLGAPDTTLYELEQDELEADARQAIDQGMSKEDFIQKMLSQDATEFGLDDGSFDTSLKIAGITEAEKIAELNKAWQTANETAAKVDKELLPDNTETPSEEENTDWHPDEYEAQIASAYDKASEHGVTNLSNSQKKGIHTFIKNHPTQMRLLYTELAHGQRRRAR